MKTTPLFDIDYFKIDFKLVIMYRKQMDNIWANLDKKMVFIIGPLQVGKTWLAIEVGKRFNCTTYLNYDYFEDREIIKKAYWHESTELLILVKILEVKNRDNSLSKNLIYFCEKY